MTSSLVSYTAIAAAIMLSSCASLPIDVPPQPAPSVLASSESLPQAQFFNATAAPLPLPSEWWTEFDDALLSDLITRALGANKQLSVAEANIDIARAGLSRGSLERGYNVGSSASASAARSASPNAFNTDLSLTGGGGIGASWEYDLFGRIEAAIKASELSVEAAEQARRDVAVVIAAETARAYVDLRGAQTRLAVAKDNADIQAQSLSLLNDLLENGRATELDVNRAEAQYRTTLANLPRFDASIDAAVARLAVLTGSNASAPDTVLRSLKSVTGRVPVLRGTMALGEPSDLLRRRPDIRRAEVEIARRLALSEVERARLFPVISFNADVRTLLDSGLGARNATGIGIGFGIGPTLSWDGPDLRRVRADIDIADAQTNLAYAVYEQTVLQALSDVETALAAYKNELRRRSDLVRAVEAARSALGLAKLRFEEGLDDFLDVLDAQRTVLESEDRLAESDLQTTLLAIETYRQLGGTL
ncbi:efflux transporter outer membrane subunit [Fretibacter rubidus]|uniref:efflux transporter outer membrane subunit n=1 Tax=Fretibacter rubidus TaxID=570162 RepID=UPI003529DD6F